MTQATTGGSTMADSTAAAEFAARGKVTEAKDGTVRFAPSGTNYELHLAAPGYAGPVGALTEGTIRVSARKVWTVSSGGNFIAPIFGPPRTIQGRVRAVSERSIVVHAGTNIVVELPQDDAAYDLVNGAIAVGAMVNIVVFPGARFEPALK